MNEFSKSKIIDSEKKNPNEYIIIYIYDITLLFIVDLLCLVISLPIFHYPFERYKCSTQFEQVCILLLSLHYYFVFYLPIRSIYYSLCIYSDWSYLPQFFIILLNAMNAPRNLSRFIFRCCHCIIILFITFPFVVFYYSLCIYSDGSYLSQFFIILLNAINVPRNLSRFIFRCCHCIIILFITFPFVVFYYSLCIYSDCSYLSQFSIILSNTINGPRNLNRFVFCCCHCIIILFFTFPFVVFIIHCASTLTGHISPNFSLSF